MLCYRFLSDILVKGEGTSPTSTNCKRKRENGATSRLRSFEAVVVWQLSTARRYVHTGRRRPLDWRKGWRPQWTRATLLRVLGRDMRMWRKVMGGLNADDVNDTLTLKYSLQIFFFWRASQARGTWQ